MGTEISRPGSLKNHLFLFEEIFQLINLCAARHKELKKRHTVNQLEGEVRTLRESLENELLRHWPEAGYPYTGAFQRFLTQDVDEAQAFILAHPDYPRLVELQNGIQEMDQQLLDLERAITRLEKIEHLLHLSRALVLLRTLGPGELERHYDALLGCESEPF